jgi:hypothetical protein
LPRIVAAAFENSSAKAGSSGSCAGMSVTTMVAGDVKEREVGQKTHWDVDGEF